MIITYLICDKCIENDIDTLVALSDWPMPEAALELMGFYIVGNQHLCKKCKEEDQ